MTVELEKDLVIGMLTVLGKLINRNATDPERKALRIEAQDGTLTFCVSSATERLLRKFETETPDPFIVHVDFDAFRDAVRTCRTRLVQFTLAGDAVLVAGNPVPLCNVPAVPLDRPRGLMHADLPAGFIGKCASAAQVVDQTNSRPDTHGINVNSHGIVAISGREMIHIPFDVKLGGLTIPVPVALIQSKCEDSGRVELWPVKKETYFRLVVGPWEWTAPAVPGEFPNWQRIIPAEEKLVRRITLSKETATQILTALRGLSDPDDQAVVWTKTADGSLNVRTGTLNCSYPAAFTGQWEKVRQGISRKILLHILAQGHDTFAFGDPVKTPFVSSGGVGRFIAMPDALPVTQTIKEETVYTKEVNVGEPGTVPVASPLDELSESIENFRAKLKSLFEESAVLLRKVREAALQQKQKEREFVQARKALERIRMAI